mgnify:CR=1 FL=1
MWQELRTELRPRGLEIVTVGIGTMQVVAFGDRDGGRRPVTTSPGHGTNRRRFGQHGRHLIEQIDMVERVKGTPNFAAARAA